MQGPQANFFVYIFGSQPRSSMQIGIAVNLQQQVQEVKHGADVNAAATGEKPRLVYYEHYNVEEIALNREREIKSRGEDSAFLLIESMNPHWLDLSDMLS
jgi:putative endonuclease